MIIKPNRIAVAAVMVALATAGVAVPAFAHTKATVSWDTCYSRANEKGADGRVKGGGSSDYARHNLFMDQCMAGKIPLTVQGRLPARELGGAFASASVPKHTSRRRAATKFRAELGTQYRLPGDLQRYDGYQPDRQIVGLHD